MQNKAKNHTEINSTPFLIVGIGASAGGLEAFSQFFASLPNNTEMAFILVQHLSPTNKSLLPEILGRLTQMPVQEVRNNVQIQPNKVYVNPPNKDIVITDSHIKLVDRESKNTHMPVDLLLKSLAEEYKERAIGIILSGTGTDGTLGLKAIKLEGGLTFVQDKTAKYEGMPTSAIASDNVEFVLSPKEIAEKLAWISRHPSLINSKDEAEEESIDKNEDGLKKILSVLKRSTDLDFNHYKSSTIKRRIAHRMLIHKIQTLEEYLQYLREHKEETEELYHDFLIHVTSFFRDNTTFDYLKESIFPKLIERLSPNETLRVWVPGSSTGEEAYSIAMSLVEFLHTESPHIPVQIFATDLSDRSIQKARAGMYTNQEVVGVSPERLASFFIKEEGQYRIKKSIREMLIFAPQNLITDPPFSHLDLISCRNTLIYMDSLLQSKIFSSFHYALKPGGILMLGKSETVGASSKFFSQLDSQYKIYIRKEIDSNKTNNLEIMIPEIDYSEVTHKGKNIQKDIPVPDVSKDADLILLSQYVPPSVLINDALEIIKFRGSTGPFLEPASGKASFNILKMVRESLTFELRSAIHKARKEGVVVRREGLQIQYDGIFRDVTIEVIPLKGNSQEKYFLILFEDANVSARRQLENLLNKRKNEQLTQDEKDKRIIQLDQELTAIRDDMRSITEEQEAVNEELQSANEEILSSNEELQSINEELQTSKEEMESTNEELTTINEELQNRNEELIESRDYAEAIIETVREPLLILDKSLRIKTANSFFYKTFHLEKETTEGEYLYKLDNNTWDIPELRTLLQSILPKNNFFNNYEIEIISKMGRRKFLLNARKLIQKANKTELILLGFEERTKEMQLDAKRDDFLGIVSHELKTPVTSLKAFGQVLSSKLAKAGDTQSVEFLEKMDAQINKLTVLIRDLLDVTKVTVGKLQFDMVYFDFDQLITNTIQDVQRTTVKHKLKIEGSTEVQVYGDKDRIEQVVINLLTNAIKFSPESDLVNIKFSKDSHNVKVCVEDFGIGVPMEHREKIFDRFFRVEGKYNTIPGMGLGLYISMEIIKRHGGTMWEENTQGGGATFCFTLPIKKKLVQQGGNAAERQNKT